MADVPDQPVARGVEDIMQRDGELDHAEAGAEMPAGDGDRVDGLLAQFGGELGQVLFRKPPQVFRNAGLGRAGGILDTDFSAHDGRGWAAQRPTLTTVLM